MAMLRVQHLGAYIHVVHIHPGYTTCHFAWGLATPGHNSHRFAYALLCKMHQMHHSISAIT